LGRLIEYLYRPGHNLIGKDDLRTFMAFASDTEAATAITIDDGRARYQARRDVHRLNRPLAALPGADAAR